MKKKENPWINVEEIQQLFGCSRSKGYQIIQQLNKELASRGFLVYSGKVSRRYFEERFYA